MRLVPTRSIIIINTIINNKKKTILMLLLIGGIARANSSKVTVTAGSCIRFLSSLSSSSSSSSTGGCFIRPPSTTSSSSSASTFNSPSTTLFKKPHSSHFSSFSRTRPLYMASTVADASADDNGISGEDMLAAFHTHAGRQRQRPVQVVQGQNVAAAMKALAMADCVCFDVDSTVVDEEGIDVLAEYLGKGQQVAAMTLQAMEGGMKFQDALKARLDLLQPSRASIEACLRDHPLRLTKGAGEFIAKLQSAKKDVHLVSGGFRIMIEPVAQLVNVSKENIVANTLLFDSNGNYCGFDPNEPTSRDMGKPAALRIIQQQHLYKTMVMIGDGATDAQAKPPATVFIGYGGIAVREKVQAVADWFVTDFDDLSYILDQYASVVQQVDK